MSALACLPEPIPIELEQLDPAPVVWSQVTPGDVMLVYFARSFGALEFNETDSTEATQALLSQVLVDDGLVTVSYDLETDTLLQITDGVFTSLTTPLIEGNDYLLSVEDYSNGSSATALATMMPFVDLTNVEAEILSIEDSSKTVRIDYSFEDLPGDTWYQVNFYSSFDDPLEIQDPTELTGLSETQILTDQTFGTTNYEGSYTLDFLTLDIVFVSINAISQGYYEYLALRERGGSFFTQVVQEPINYPTNVIGGYGFFNLAIPDVEVVVVEE